ncbi:hypothetical protein [Lewinella sp. LCG006]|uniref:hypothetical protein n=1 Tax=Lewinella sp. LCG006 TaxID=3231911 RepID=UPI003460D195
MKQVKEQQLATGIRLSVVLSLLFAVSLLWSNTCLPVASFWNYYSAVQQDGRVLKDNSDKSSQFCFFQTEEVEEKESEENSSADHTDCNRCISGLGICSNPILSLYDSALLSSPPLKRYLLFHALKLDC